VLADIAFHEPDAFRGIVERVQARCDHGAGCGHADREAN
jgi:hypothetical protein